MFPREKLMQQLKRAYYFLDVAKQFIQLQEHWRNLMAATYFGVSVPDQLLALAEQDFIRIERGVLKDQLVNMMPHYELLDLIRIHDFHKGTLLPILPNTFARLGGFQVQAVGSGTAALSLTGNEPTQKIRTGQGTKLKTGRALEQRGVAFRLDGDTAFIELKVAVDEFLATGEKTITHFFPPPPTT